MWALRLALIEPSVDYLSGVVDQSREKENSHRDTLLDGAGGYQRVCTCVLSFIVRKSLSVLAIFLFYLHLIIYFIFEYFKQYLLEFLPILFLLFFITHRINIYLNIKMKILTRCRENYTNKIDVWSLGIMAYECYKGTPPYYEHDDYIALSYIAKDGVSHLIKKLTRASDTFKRFLDR